MCCIRSARLVGLNVVGMRRRGIAQDAIRAVQPTYQALFEGEGEFSARIDKVEADHGAVPEVAQIVAFLRAAKKPVMMTRPRGSNAERSNNP